MKPIIPLMSIAGPSFTSNSLGIHTTILEVGWERWMSERLVSDIPCMDEAIEATGWVCVDRVPGNRSGGGSKVGTGVDGGDIRCDMRGLEDFHLLDQLLPGFVKHAAKRTERCRALGGRSMLYTASAPLTLFPQNMPTGQRNFVIDQYLRPARDAGFDILAMDASAPLAQIPTKTDTLFVAERWVSYGDGREFAIESCERPHPKLYPLYDGRFSSVVPHCERPGDSRWTLITKSPGWYSPSAPGCLKAFYPWLQGSVPVADRMRLADECVSQGHRPVVDLGGLADSWWNDAVG